MQYQAQKMAVVTHGTYAIHFYTDTNSSIQVSCSVSDDGQIHFDMTGIPQPLLQALSTSAAWKQAIRSFHEVSAISYYVSDEYSSVPSWAHVPIHLHEIEKESDNTCKLQFMEPDKSLKTIQVDIGGIGDERIHGFMMDGDTTVTNRIFSPRDMYRVTKDFLDAVHE